MTRNIAWRILAIFNTYYFVAEFRLSQQFLKVSWLWLTVYKFDAFKFWNIISLKDFNEILHCIIYRWIICIKCRNKWWRLNCLWFSWFPKFIFAEFLGVFWYHLLLYRRDSHIFLGFPLILTDILISFVDFPLWYKFFVVE